MSLATEFTLGTGFPEQVFELEEFSMEGKKNPNFCQGSSLYVNKLQQQIADTVTLPSTVSICIPQELITHKGKKSHLKWIWAPGVRKKTNNNFLTGGSNSSQETQR